MHNCTSYLPLIDDRFLPNGQFEAKTKRCNSDMTSLSHADGRLINRCKCQRGNNVKSGI